MGQQYEKAKNDQRFVPTPSAKKISVCIIVIINLISAASSVRCYFCTVKLTSKDRQTMAAHRKQSLNSTANMDDDIPIYKPKLCSQFDGGERFQIDCPLSTLCQARTFKLHTQSRGSISVTTRGCARQDYSYQTYRKGRGWHTVTSVDEDAYDPGCFDAVGSDTLRRHRTTYCFCDTDLCNGLENSYRSNTNDTTEKVSGQTSKVPNNIIVVWCFIALVLRLGID